MKRMNFLSSIMVGLLVIGLLTWTTPAASQDTPGVWKLAGSMATDRRYGGDARLRDGRILAMGGTNTTGVDGAASIFYETAEIYDPATATWTAANSLTTGGRALFSVAGLPKWNILISGGWNGSVALSSAEVYDQDTGTFSATGSMKMARREHRSTTLFDGRVLITGGFNSAGTPTATAEIYDPVAGTFSFTKGNMTVARAAHRMNTVSDGKVLITGGFGVGGTALATAELFDPAKGTFSSVGVGSLAHARARHSATQLPTGEIFLAGGNSGSGVLDSTEIYDPDFKTFRAGPSLNQARQSHTFPLLPNGLVLIAGGNNNPSTAWDIQTNFLSSCELYDPATNKIKTTGSMINAASAGLPYLLWTGKFMYAGGGTNETELYTPEMPGTLETWEAGGTMATGRTDAFWSVLDDGTVLVTGGFDSAGNVLASAELYDYLTGAFTTTTGSMSTPRQQHRTVQLYTGKVLVTGGRSDPNSSLNGLNSAELYDPASGTFTPTGNLPGHTMLQYRRLHRSTELANGKILITGGLGGTSNTQNNVLALAEIYDPDPTKQTFTQTAGDMVTARRSHQAILLRTGKVLIVGGNGTSGTLLNSAELYDPDTDTFTATSNTMSVPRAPFLTMLPDGKVLVSNGSSTPNQAMDIYDPATDKFAPAANELVARNSNRVTRLPNGKVILVGGQTTSANTSVTDSGELYSHLINTVTSTDNLITGRRNFVLANLGDGRILVAGGVDANSTVLSSSELYTPLIADEVDTTITSGPDAVTGKTSATFTFTSNPAGGTFKCSLDNAAFAACTSPKIYSSLLTGRHRFQVYATDSLGNVDPTPATYNWTVNTTPIEVTPGDGLTSSGFQGGPFIPASKSYTITNKGGDTVNWTASKTKDWVTLSNTGGALDTGKSITVTVQINSQANALSPGNYGDTIGFTNTTNGFGNTTRVVDLTVNQCPTPGIPSSPSPSEGATAVSIKPTLSWAPSSGADSYDIYFGTSSNPPIVKNTTVPNYPVSGLKDNTKYYWKIVAKNNCGNSTPGPVWSFKTVYVSLPDLLVSVSNPPSGPLGQGNSFAVTDTVQNQGNVAAGASTTHYYLSIDTVKGIGDILLTGKRAVPALPVGATSKGTVTVTIPKGVAAGAYYLLACADDMGLVPEADEKNNCIASGSTVAVSLPDLVETSVSNPPSGPLTGGNTFSVTDTVQNQGNVAAIASTTRYYLSTNPVKEGGDILLTGIRAVPALQAGATSTGKATVTIPKGVAAAAYYLLACADDTGLVPETDETNNCTASVTTVVMSLPDLVEVSVSNPPSGPLTGGNTFSVTDTVQNQGNVAAGASTTRYYLSTGTTKGSGDILLTGTRAVPALQAGGPLSKGTMTVKIPTGAAAGTYYLLACANDTKVVPETDEKNNCTASGSTVAVSLPDLVETLLTISPPSGPLGQGSSFAVTDTVQNQGSVAAGASTTRYYLSTDTTKGTGDILLTGSRAVPALQLGATSKGTVTVKIPPVATAGTYYLLACANDTKVVPETDETNNCIASVTTVVMSLPDLVEVSVSNPPSGPLTGGNTFSVTDTVKNQGNVAAIASATRYYLSEDNTKGGGDILLTGSRAVPALQLGATSKGTVTVKIPAETTAGTYYLLACADDTGLVSETDETNNCTASSSKVVVSRPDLVKLFVSDPPSGPLTQGNSFAVIDMVQNQGNVAAGASTTRYYLSTNTAKEGADILLTGSRPVPALQAGAILTGKALVVTIPKGTAAGTYYLLACADDMGLVLETDEANNCIASNSTVEVFP